MSGVVQQLSIIGHGNWDGQTRFTVPSNIDLYYFYPAESGSSLCYRPADVPTLCRQAPRDVRQHGQQAPDFSVTGGVPGLVNGVRNCIVGSQFEDGRDAMIQPLSAGTTYKLSDIVAYVSGGLAQTGQTAVIRMMLCGGGNEMMNAVSGVSMPEAEAVAAMHRRNGEAAYTLARQHGRTHNQATAYALAIQAGRTPQQAEIEMNQVAGRKRRSTRRRRTRTKRISSHKYKTK